MANVSPRLGWGQLRMPGSAHIEVNGLGFPAPVLALRGRAHLRGSWKQKPPSPEGALSSSYWDKPDGGFGCSVWARGGGGEGSLQRGWPEQGPVEQPGWGGSNVIRGRPLGSRPGELWLARLLSRHIALCTNHLLSSFFFCPHPPTSLHF